MTKADLTRLESSAALKEIAKKDIDEIVAKVEEAAKNGEYQVVIPVIVTKEQSKSEDFMKNLGKRLAGVKLYLQDNGYNTWIQNSKPINIHIWW